MTQKDPAGDIPIRQVPAVELCAEILSRIVYMASMKPSWGGVSVDALRNGAVGSVVRKGGRDLCLVRVLAEGSPICGVMIQADDESPCFDDFGPALDYVAGLL